jgi:hypothetical protein
MSPPGAGGIDVLVLVHDAGMGLVRGRRHGRSAEKSFDLELEALISIHAVGNFAVEGE